MLGSCSVEDHPRPLPTVYRGLLGVHSRMMVDHMMQEVLILIVSFGSFSPESEFCLVLTISLSLNLQELIKTRPLSVYLDSVIVVRN